MNYKHLALTLLVLSFAAACNGTDPLPKPKAQIRLEYPKGQLANLETDDFSFSYNQLAAPKQNKDNAFTIAYPDMKGAIFLSYIAVDDNLEQLIRDAKRLSYEHAAKAENIVEQPFVNPDAKVFGSLFEVQGNAASQTQFFVTDSTRHFLTGSVYFYAKPNYDSILPAAAYLQNDIRGIMETLRWK